MQLRVPIGATMLGAGLLTAQFVAARAARDAIYLTHLDVTTLPQIVIATAACSIGLVVLSSASFRRWSPTALVPLAFSLSAALFSGVDARRDEAVWIRQEPCEGGTAVLDRYYVCPPETR